MGQRGPIKQRTDLRELRGNPSKEPPPKKAPAPGGRPRRPSWLDPIARKKWGEVVREMKEAGTLSRAAGDLIVAYCVACSDFQQAAEAVIREGGPTFTDDKGNVRQRPEVAIKQKALDHIKQYARELLISPAARQSIGVIRKAQKKTKLEELMGIDP